MTVAPQKQATVDDIIRQVAPTGMRASVVAEGAAAALLYRVHGLDCKNEVAALIRELGPLVGEDRLAFDTTQGMMTVGPQSLAAASAIEEAVARTGMRAERWSPPSATTEKPIQRKSPSDSMRLRHRCSGGRQSADLNPLAGQSRVSHPWHGLRR